MLLIHVSHCFLKGINFIIISKFVYLMLVGLAKSKSFQAELSQMEEEAGPQFLTLLHSWVFSSPVGYLIVDVFSVYVCQVEHDLDQIDYIDSCATEEEEEEVRQPKCLDSDSLSSQFMAYIDQRRISNEVVLLLEIIKFTHPSRALVKTLPS